MHRRSLLKAGLLSLPIGLGVSALARAAAPLRVAAYANYNVPAVLTEFTQQHNVPVKLIEFDSNEDLLAACVRGERFDLITISHYMVPHFAALGLLRPIGSKLTHSLQPFHWNARLAQHGQIDGRWLALPKNYGTTGFIYRQSKLPVLTRWRDFWDALPKASRRSCVIEDVQTLIGAALRYDGHSINSTRPNDLIQAEQLLKRSRPHLRALVADVDAAVARGDWLAMAWSDSGYSMTQVDADLRFVNPLDGGESWCDFYAIAANSAEPENAELLLGWLLQPAQVAREVIELGVSPVDERVLPLLPEAVRSNPIIFPPREVLADTEMSAQEALREPLRNEIFARFAASF
jgi:spermidine/putrescine transport system substrate-binding protein